MASKKSPFVVFLTCHRTDEINKGNKAPTFKELCTKFTPIWNALTNDEKEKYKVLANKYNSTQVKKQPLKQISDLQNNSYEFWNMQTYINQMFECISNNEELLKKKFILLHINCHTEEVEQYYFPAEIAALEFSLIDGISRTYHQVIGISEIYPRGFAGGMKQFSDHFHRILCFDKHRDDYQQILLEFSTFLKNGIINHADLKEGTLDLPCLFTIESEIGTNMMNTQKSLERLYSTAYPRVDDERCKSIFKIGSVQKLLLEIKKKLNLHLNPQNLRSGNSVCDILESDMYGYGLGCKYHESRDISYKCSKARIIQWMSNICKHICENTGLSLKPGSHVPVELRNGSKLGLITPSIGVVLLLVKMDTVEDEAHYDSKFLGSDADENGYVSGLEFLYYYKHGVCDINRHRKLDKEQFSPEMWLVESKLKRGLIHQIHFPLK